MEEREIRKIVAEYFGITPTVNLNKVKIKVYTAAELDAPAGEVKVRIRWEEHIGNRSGVARISPLDIMYQLGMEFNDENYRKAVDIMKTLAKRQNLYFVEVEGDRYLLINPKYRR